MSGSLKVFFFFLGISKLLGIGDSVNWRSGSRFLLSGGRCSFLFKIEERKTKKAKAGAGVVTEGRRFLTSWFFFSLCSRCRRAFACDEGQQFGLALGKVRL
jgi:hypothetical protein